VAEGSNGAPPLRAAAFFDLDKTLMAGSSGIFFARAAYEAGMITRGRLLGDLWQNLRFRLRGSTDDWADEVRRRCATLGQVVRVTLPGEEITGLAAAIDDAGQLVVETAAGPRRVTAGDVVHLRPG